MDSPNPRFWELFLQAFESLPRQGPGGRTWTRRALESCAALPPAPKVLDLGCGVGAQALDLAELTSGVVVGLDNHQPFVERFRASVFERGLEDRLLPFVGDMGRPGTSPGAFDLVWSEGALYNIGLECGLKVCFSALRPGGCVAFTEAVWCTDDAPAVVRASFEDYAAMGKVPDARGVIARSGFELIDHFTLPDEAWWSDFYTPLLEEIAQLREAHADDDEALAILDQLEAEPRMRRDHGDTYAYEFFVARKPAS